MLKLKKVAVTGGLSCGKSSVCKLFKELGAYIMGADETVHQLLSSDTKIGQEVTQLLGSSVIVNNRIDRSRIAEIVFQDPQLLLKYEEILHPAVYKLIDDQYMEQQQKNQFPLFIAEIPLLFESGGEKKFDITVAVVANPKICMERYTKMTGHDPEEYERRALRQLPILDKALRADYVIMNNSSLANLQDVTKELYQELIE